MNRKVFLSVFAVVILVQLAVPASMILRREAILRDGKQFRFRTDPSDRYGGLQGRCMWLNLMPRESRYNRGPIHRGRTLFARVEEGDDGFVRVVSVSLERPESGDYIKAKATHASSENKVGIVWPFSRYYMEESLSAKAEEVYLDRFGRESWNSCVLVRVKDGASAVEKLLINDVPINEFLESQ